MFSIFLKGALIVAALTFFLNLLTGFFPAEVSALPLSTFLAVLNAIHGLIQTGIYFTTPIINWSFVAALITLWVWLLLFGFSFKVAVFVWNIIKYL